MRCNSNARWYVMRVLTVFGTRPEAIKLAPVVLAFARCNVEHAVCVTGQHREMLDQVVKLFRIRASYDLDLMRPSQALGQLTGKILRRLKDVLDDFKPDCVVVQGDTTTAFAAALASFYERLRVAHVEAGLRTGNIYSPWPEEINRKLVSALATLHFAPTEWARSNLLAEGIRRETILVTGNTVIDAVQWIADRLASDPVLRAECDDRVKFLSPSRRLILVTGHRRENFDGGLAHVCRALRRVAMRGDVEIIYPVHLNPKVQAIVYATLRGRKNVFLVQPVDYLLFVRLMQRAYVIVTDSGGIQEEAPGLGKPVLVTRNTTERPEAISAGTARLVGTDEDGLVAAIGELLGNEDTYARMAQARNPFGDGRAAARIVERILEDMQHEPRRQKPLRQDQRNRARLHWPAYRGSLRHEWREGQRG
jgi:UDP-N-acetylglucosamine 2-epimerase (non-hydrolysing)